MSWTTPFVLSMLIGGVILLAAFIIIEQRVKAPMFRLDLFRIRAFAAGNIATLMSSLGARRIYVDADHLAAGYLAAAAWL